MSTIEHSLSDNRRGAEWALAVAVALDVGLVERIASGPCSAETAAASHGLEPRATRALLDVLVARGLAQRDDAGAYALSSAGHDRLLDEKSPRYEGAQLRIWRRNFTEWAVRLPGVARGEEPPGPSEGDARDLAGFMAAMAAKPRAQVDRVVDLCLAAAPERGRALDLGGGPGTYARAFAERGLETVLFDRPEVIEHVRGAYGLDAVEGLATEGGDFTVALPDGRFGLVFLGNITHNLGPDANRALLAAIRERLVPGGVVAALDFVRDRSDFAALFAFTMLLRTADGRTYGSDEYVEWMEAAGLRDVRFERVDDDRHLVMARATDE